jgi:hypothetical protein
MNPTARTLALVASIALLVSGCQETGAADLSVATPMDFVRTVAEPGVGDGSEWLSRPTRIRYDAGSGTLFALEWADAAVQEFTTSGDYVRTYGGVRGEGPGEIKNIRTFDLGAEFVAVFDGGASKVLLFDRQDASLIQEMILGRMIWDMTVVGDTAIAIVPGSDNAAFDLLDLEGNVLAQAGDGGFLNPGFCRCVIRDIADERVVIVQTERAEGRVLGLDGNLHTAFGFYELADVLARWSEDFRESVRQLGRMAAESGSGRIIGGKNFVGEVVSLGNGTFYAILVPEKTDEEPLELWVMDRDARVVERHAFGRTRVGGFADGFPTVYGVGFSDSSIHKFLVRR